MRCPGQDRRYWTEDAVFEVPCPECGAAVEFFKDETSGRCPSCGGRFKNPGIDFGCAQWCALAGECLGFVPQRESLTGAGGAAPAGRLIQAVKEQFAPDQDRISHALMVFQQAKRLASKEGGDPRVILASALLLGIGTPRSAEHQTGRTDGPSKAKQILQQIGVDEDTIAQVCEIIGSYQTGGELDTAEFRIVRDADTLAKLATAPSGDRDKLEEIIESQLSTEAAKQQARSLFQA